MSKCKKIKDWFDRAYGRELDEAQRKIFENHLRECSNCRSDFAETSAMLNFMTKKKRSEPGPVFWENYWDELYDRMNREEFKAVKRENKRVRLFPSINFNVRWVARAAAAVALLILGIFIGREIFPPAAPPGKGIGRQAVLASRQGAPEELIQRARHFIERSKLMLLAIVNFDPESEDFYTLDIPYQQQVSKELVRQAGGIKTGLSSSGQRRLRDLINDLEVILLQVANLDPGQNRSAVRFIKDGVNIRGVLFKIRLIDMRRSFSKQNKETKI